MEHGGGAPAGASSDVGQANVASFEVAMEYGNSSNETSLVQSHDFASEGNTADSHSEQSGELDLAEGEVVSFGSMDRETEATDGKTNESEENEGEEAQAEGIFSDTDTEVAEPEQTMDPDESIQIAKNEGFEPALEYYANFGSDKAAIGDIDQNDEGKEMNQEIDEDVDNTTDQEEDMDQEPEQTDEDTDETQNQDIERSWPQEDLMQNPEVRHMLDQMKNHSEMFRMLIERLEKQQQITAEMLAMIAALMKEALENKKEKDEDDKTLIGAIANFIGFLMGMITDPGRESNKLERDLSKAA